LTFLEASREPVVPETIAMSLKIRRDTVSASLKGLHQRGEAFSLEEGRSTLPF